jgi:hypothetical protein
VGKCKRCIIIRIPELEALKPLLWIILRIFVIVVIVPAVWVALDDRAK